MNRLKAYYKMDDTDNIEAIDLGYLEKEHGLEWVADLIKYGSHQDKDFVYSMNKDRLQKTINKFA